MRVSTGKVELNFLYTDDAVWKILFKIPPEKENMCLNRCTCATSKRTDSDKQPQRELADDVTGGKLCGWPVTDRKERKREVDR